MKTILTIAALLVSVSVQAQPAQYYNPGDAKIFVVLQTSLEKHLGEVSTLEGTLGNITVENDRLMKENKVLDENRKVQVAQLDGLIKVAQQQLANEQAQRQAVIDAIIAQYNATGCSGQITQDRLTYCQGLHAQALARIESLKAEGNAYLARERDRKNAELRPVQDIIRRQTVRIDQIVATMTSNFNTFTSTQDKLKHAKEQVSRIRLELTNLCTNPNATPAAKQLCEVHRSGWDGTRRPPLTGPRRGTEVERNQ
jgi:chromosome segregation ATPase